MELSRDPTEPGRLMCLDIVGVTRQLNDLMSRRLAQYGVTIGQLPALLALYAKDGLTQSELARRTGVEQPTMALTLKRMTRDGLVRRVTNPADRRAAHIHLTERAQSIRDALQASRADLDEIALGGLSASERLMLANLLRRMAHNLGSV